MASSSSAPNPRHLLNHLYGGHTSAPPPTPSTQPSLSPTSDAAADTLSRLLHRLPPSLSLPTRLSPRFAKSSSSTPSTPLPTLSALSSSSLSSSSNIFLLGYFQLTHHSITSQLAESAESDSLSLFDLPHEAKLSSFSYDWPLGFNENDDDEDGDHRAGSFCLDDQCFTTTESTTTTTELNLESLRELTRGLEKVGLEVVESLACEVGFENPFREDGMGPKHSTLMWVSSSDGEKAGREVYPYVVGLQYQIRPGKWDLLSDSGSVNVEPQVGSLLVTLGDIAQVWSNGKLKKVRGRPAPVSTSDDLKSSLPCISMTMLLTLPLESTVSPLLFVPKKSMDHNNRKREACEAEKDKEGNSNDENDDQRVFHSFSFEDYAWRVYHERLITKDPLDRYRIID